MKVKLFEIVTDQDKISFSSVVDVLNNKSSIKDYACILHDKDGTRPHYHIAVRLKDSYDTKYIAEWFGIAENFVSKVKGRWSDMLKYLTHENAPEKFQYDENEVLSNFDWKVEKDKVSGKERLEEIINKIVDGEIREYNYMESITPIEYDRYSRSIERAFKYRTDKIKGVSRDMNCVFITGDSGVGKTTYAKQIAQEKGYSVYISSGSNDILDDYKGQDCIILDDLRPSCLGLSDLLKMLDNHTASTVKSRYRNKVLECRMIIITTTLDIDTFFSGVFSEEKETIIQLKRRCKLHIRMDMDYVYLKMWQEKSRQYSKEFVQKNAVTFANNVKDMNDDEILGAMSEILGNSQVIVDDIKKNLNEYKQDELELVDDENNPF